MKQTHYVLVATSVEEQPILSDGEKMKRFSSIIGLSILGGFSGMGLVWILICIIVPILKIQENKFLPLIFPLFVTGWIISAIVSFFFFQFIYKTKGKTRFVREQTERKYLGYGGLEADLNWWNFLGIPIPLIAILTFTLEPFAHTDVQKAGIAVGVLMVVFAASMYLCDRIPRRIVFRLGLLGWVLTIIGGYCFFKIHGP